MKPYLSVTALWLRRCLRKLALLLAALFVLDAAAFFLALRGHAREGLEAVLAAAHVGLIAGAAFLLLCAWLFYVGGEFSARPSYTLRRLSVTPLGGFLARWAACGACFAILWGAQTAAALGLCFLYKRLGPPELWSRQAVLLAFYRNAFLHGLLPLHDTTLWVRNALLCLALGAAAARMPARKKFGVLLHSAVLTAMWFRCEPGCLVLPLLLILLCGIVIAVELYKAAAGEEGDDREAQTP